MATTPEPAAPSEPGAPSRPVNGGMTPWEAALDRAAGVLHEARSVALACHINPDPDAIGSMLGLAHLLAAGGAKVVCSWGNQPFSRPRWLAALGEQDFVVEPRRFPREPAVMVTLDTASSDRLGMLLANANRAKEVIVLDHHRTNPGFGTIPVIDPDASSTAELVFHLTERMGVALPDAAAPCLYAGLVTDTGRFQYEATTPETLRVAGELRKHPFDHSRLAQILFEDNGLGYLRLTAVALDRLVHVPAASLVWTYLTQDDIARERVAMSETDDLIDVIRTAREADVAGVLKQQRDGRFKVSLRSRGGTDVGSVALGFGGGGHRLAAGYTGTSGLVEAASTMVAAVAAVRNGHPAGEGQPGADGDGR
jgi:phosphoesterase RecJ-like protein